MKNNIQVGVSIILIKDNTVLIGKRLGSHGAGQYALPGGHVEFGEAYNTTGIRELKEETGVDFEGCEFGNFGFSEDFFPEKNAHYITLYLYYYVGDDINVENLEPEKCEGWNWVSINELPENMFCHTKEKLNELKDMLL